MKTSESERALLMAFLLLLVLAVARGDDYTYSMDQGEIAITGYTGAGGAINIPGSLDGLPVTRIGTKAFYNNSTVTSVMVPASVTTIGQEAFSTVTSLTNVAIGPNVRLLDGFAFFQCSSLQSVLVPNNVTAIGCFAFENCWSLTSVDIGTGVTNIGIGAFANCGSLAEIRVAKNNSTYLSDAGVVFDHTMSSLIAYPAGRKGLSYTIPTGVVSIGDCALQGCSVIAVSVPNSLTNIGHGAFTDCNALTTVTLSSNVVGIGSSAFLGCSSLLKLTIPGSVRGIGDYAFMYCSNLGALYFDGDAPSVGVKAFDQDDKVTVYYLPGTRGWGLMFAGVPAMKLDANYGPGGLQVVIVPPRAVAAGARWEVDGGPPQSSGAAVSGLTVGNHTVTFDEIEGWIKPAELTVSINLTSAASYVGDYTEVMGSTTNTDGVTITKYSGPGGVLKIPDTIEGLPVTSIADRAFLGNTSVVRPRPRRGSLRRRLARLGE